MLEFWNNPEFVRYRRAELRPGRMVAATGVTVVLCYLIGLLIHASEADRATYFTGFYFTILIMQSAMVCLWSFGACAQAVSLERDRKTWDFQRTTRMSALDLTIGKLLGAPVMGYFIFALVSPLLFVLALLAGFGPIAFLGSELLVVMTALLLGLIGLAVSMKVERHSPAVSVLGVFFSLWLVGLLASLSSGADGQLFPGLSAITVVPSLLQLYGTAIRDAPTFPIPRFFGVAVPYLALTVGLYASFGAWLVAMLRRGLKKDFGEIRVLSRWQALGLLLYLHLLFFGFLNPRARVGYGVALISAEDIGAMAVFLNLSACGVVGLMTITPTIYFKSWFRERAAGRESYFSENGPPWPWILLAVTTGAALLGAYALANQPLFPLVSWHSQRLAMYLFVWTSYLLRDILFLQFLALTRIRRSLAAGLGLLILYYFACSVVGGVVSQSSDTAGKIVFGLFTPFFSFLQDTLKGWESGLPAAGAALQLAVSALLLTVIDQRLAEKAVYPMKKAA